jgi:hypothetical protein
MSGFDHIDATCRCSAAAVAAAYEATWRRDKREQTSAIFS